MSYPTCISFTWMNSTSDQDYFPSCQFFFRAIIVCYFNKRNVQATETFAKRFNFSYFMSFSNFGVNKISKTGTFSIDFIFLFLNWYYNIILNRFYVFQKHRIGVGNCCCEPNNVVIVFKFIIKFNCVEDSASSDNPFVYDIFTGSVPPKSIRILIFTSFVCDYISEGRTRLGETLDRINWCILYNSQCLGLLLGSYIDSLLKNKTSECFHLY